MRNQTEVVFIAAPKGAGLASRRGRQKVWVVEAFPILEPLLQYH